jgi:hypothetical protein
MRYVMAVTRWVSGAHVQCNVVRREAVAILTAGTLTDPDMLGSQPEAAHVLSLWERPLPPPAPGAPAGALLGACYVDCASNTFLLGQWCAPAALPSCCMLCLMPRCPHLGASRSHSVQLRPWASGARGSPPLLLHAVPGTCHA